MRWQGTCQYKSPLALPFPPSPSVCRQFILKNVRNRPGIQNSGWENPGPINKFPLSAVNCFVGIKILKIYIALGCVDVGSGELIFKYKFVIAFATRYFPPQKKLCTMYWGSYQCYRRSLISFPKLPDNQFSSFFEFPVPLRLSEWLKWLIILLLPIMICRFIADWNQFIRRRNRCAVLCGVIRQLSGKRKEPIFGLFDITRKARVSTCPLRGDYHFTHKCLRILSCTIHILSR